MADMLELSDLRAVTRSKVEHSGNKWKDRKSWQRNTRYKEQIVHFRTEK